MGAGIIIPVILIAVFVPAAFTMAKRYLKDGAAIGADEPIVAPSARLTSNAVRELPTPTWRVVYEISEEKLGGPSHVLIGPAGIFAVQTSMEPLPARPEGPPDSHAVAAAAIARGGLDDALRRCAMTSGHLLTVHWGASEDGAPTAVEPFPGAIAVDGRSLSRWGERTLADIAADPTREPLSQARVDLAWQTVTTAIGRPDPLA
jgi:hypothetical protein